MCQRSKYTCAVNFSLHSTLRSKGSRDLGTWGSRPCLGALMLHNVQKLNIGLRWMIRHLVKHEELSFLEVWVHTGCWVWGFSEGSATRVTGMTLSHVHLHQEMMNPAIQVPWSCVNAIVTSAVLSPVLLYFFS